MQTDSNSLTRHAAAAAVKDDWSAATEVEDVVVVAMVSSQMEKGIHFIMIMSREKEEDKDDYAKDTDSRLWKLLCTTDGPPNNHKKFLNYNFPVYCHNFSHIPTTVNVILVLRRGKLEFIKFKQMAGIN